MGIVDFDKKYDLKDIVKGDSIFCATAITTSMQLNGIIRDNDKYKSETLVTHKSSDMKSVIKKEFLFEKKQIK